MFRQKEQCTLVRGVIKAAGWCKHWEKKDGYKK